MLTAPPARPATHHGPHPAIRVLKWLVVSALIAVLGLSATTFVALTAVRTLSTSDDLDSATLGTAIWTVSLDLIGERPRREPEPLRGAVPICPSVPANSIPALKRGFALMRTTVEGSRLYDVLVAEDICVEIDDLPFNAAYALSREVNPGNWSESYIVVDRRLVRSGAADVLAAVLVHEATHIDRAVSGAACFINDTCRRLPNGVEIDEEIAAHSAEVEWWIETFGTDGKRFAFRNDYGENQLAEAYLRGEASFREYVSAYRSDPRESSR